MLAAILAFMLSVLLSQTRPSLPFNYATPLVAGVGPMLVAAPTITPTFQFHHVSGKGSISTIQVPAGLTFAMIVLIPDDPFAMTTAGNIGKATKGTPGLAMFLIWDGTKWWPSY